MYASIQLTTLAIGLNKLATELYNNYLLITVVMDIQNTCFKYISNNFVAIVSIQFNSNRAKKWVTSR